MLGKFGKIPMCVAFISDPFVRHIGSGLCIGVTFSRGAVGWAQLSVAVVSTKAVLVVKGCCKGKFLLFVSLTLFTKHAASRPRQAFKSFCTCLILKCLVLPPMMSLNVASVLCAASFHSLVQLREE